MSNKRKDELLGMPHGTANGHLMKMILWDLASKLGLLVCFRCGDPINVPRGQTSDALSVEHKEPWMQAKDPRASFFDLNNIAFSHLSCNSKASQYWKGRKLTKAHKEHISTRLREHPPSHLYASAAKGRAAQAAAGNPELRKGHETQSRLATERRNNAGLMENGVR